MKTCLVTTAYLDNEIYHAKTVKFVKHYKKHFSDIFVLDNGSVKPHRIVGAKILTQYPKYMRTAHLEYFYLWRAIYSSESFFEMGYDKVIYFDNDFFVLSSEMFEVIKLINKGWNVPYCKKHNFSETGAQVIMNNCQEYHDFVKDGQFWKHNGKCMETTLPVTNIMRQFIGDRWSEYAGITAPPLSSDFSAQTPLEWKIEN